MYIVFPVPYGWEGGNELVVQERMNEQPQALTRFVKFGSCGPNFCGESDLGGKGGKISIEVTEFHCVSAHV